MFIFNYIGSIFGYVLWAIYYIFNNFGVAIIIFTILTRLLVFPASVKQQKSMAANSRMQAKQKEIREKYANNKQKQNEEIQKLYEKEGVSPFGGCLTSLFPLFILMGIYYSVARPLSNVLHIAESTMTDVIKFINGIPGVNVASSSFYHEMDILRLFSNPNSMELLKNHGDGIGSVLTSGQISEIQNLAGGFNFLGLNLLDIPNNFAFFSNIIIIIPILVLITSIGSQIATMKIQGDMMNQQQGCMKYMMLALPLFSVYISYIVPGAVGFYWIWSTIIGFAQTLIISKFYSPASITAMKEAQHVALMEQKEAAVPYSPVYRAPEPQTKPQTKKKKK